MRRFEWIKYANSVGNFECIKYSIKFLRYSVTADMIQMIHSKGIKRERACDWSRVGQYKQKLKLSNFGHTLF